VTDEPNSCGGISRHRGDRGRRRYVAIGAGIPADADTGFEAAVAALLQSSTPPSI